MDAKSGGMAYAHVCQVYLVSGCQAACELKEFGFLHGSSF
jgi:hypothetical protein